MAGGHCDPEWPVGLWPSRFVLLSLVVPMFECHHHRGRLLRFHRYFTSLSCFVHEFPPLFLDCYQNWTKLLSWYSSGGRGLMETELRVFLSCTKSTIKFILWTAPIRISIRSFRCCKIQVLKDWNSGSWQARGSEGGLCLDQWIFVLFLSAERTPKCYTCKNDSRLFLSCTCK